MLYNEIIDVARCHIRVMSGASTANYRWTEMIYGYASVYFTLETLIVNVIPLKDVV